MPGGARTQDRVAWGRAALLRHDRRVWLTAFCALLAATYFVAGRLSGNLALACFLIPLLLHGPAERKAFATTRPVVGAGWFLLGAAGWSILSLMVNAAALGTAAEKVTNFLLLALFLAFVHGLLRRVPLRQMLLALAGFAALNALASMVAHVAEQGAVFSRLVPLGRPVNAIPGAGGIAAGVLALAALMLNRPGWSRMGWVVASIVLAAMLAAIVWTQSRGPLLGLLAGFAAMRPFSTAAARPAALFAVCLLVWAGVTGIVLFGDPLRALFCRSALELCRESMRTELWQWVFDTTRAHPVFGTSTAFRFPDALRNHPHNGLFGLMMFYGPVFLAACLGAFLALLRRWPSVGGVAERSYIAGSLVFSFGYMGSDLSDPFAFFNMHYLFLWLPLGCLASSSGRAQAGLGEGRPEHAHDPASH